MKLVVGANSWREVWAFTRVYVAVWLSYMVSFWPGVTERRLAAEEAEMDDAFIDEIAEALSGVDTHVHHRSDGTIESKRLSDGITEAQEVAIDTMVNRWKEEAVEELGAVTLRVSIGFGGEVDEPGA
jgi:hypothetical protein